MANNKEKNIEHKIENANKKYNLKNDIIFKAFFARKGNEIFLIDFLEALLNIKIERIKIKEEVNLEQLAYNEKGGRLDLQAKLNDGVIVNIELQMKNHFNIFERTTLYAAKTISREDDRGKDYNEISKVIMINILGYNILDYEEYISDTVIVLNKHRDYEMLKGIKWYFIELPKFRNQNPDMNEKINQWLAVLDDCNEEAIKMAEKKNKILKKAREEINYLTGDAAVRRLAELREDWEIDYAMGVNGAKRAGFEDGQRVGFEDGKKVGFEDGQKAGFENGKKEIAENLLKLGMEIEKISEATGLTLEEIKNLKNDNKNKY